MIDNLEYAIAHAKEVAKKNKTLAKTYESFKDYGNPKSSITAGHKRCLECAENHEQLAAWLTELAERREADRWNVIHSKEDLPKESGKCLVSLDFGDVSIDYYDKDWGFVCYVGNVVAWKPKPEPYKKEGE